MAGARDDFNAAVNQAVTEAEIPPTATDRAGEPEPYMPS